MRILFVLGDFAAPPRTGPQRLDYLLLRYLLDHGFECKLFGFLRPGIDTDLEAAAREFPGLEVAGLFRWRHGYATETALGWAQNAILGRRIGYRTFESALENALRDPALDLVHVEGVALAGWIGKITNKPLVFNELDAMSLNQQRLCEEAPGKLGKLRYYMGANLARHIERTTLPRVTKALVYSPVDAQYLRSTVPGADVECVGVSVPEPAPGARDLLSNDDTLEPRILFSGELQGHLGRALLWFLNEVHPKIELAVPGLKTTIIGRGGAFPALARAMEKTPGISVMDWVENYDAEVAAACVFVAPDRCGTGIKNRVVTAMALGCPVVGTSVAFEGIPIETWAARFRCDAADRFAQSVVALLQDRSLRQRTGEAARHFALTRYSITNVGLRWVEFYHRAIAKFAGTVSKAAQTSEKALAAGSAAQV